MKRVTQRRMTAIGLAMTMTTMTATMTAAALWAQAPVEVELKDGQGQPVGTATLSSAMGAVHIQLDLKNLKPGPHAIHVHTTPKCEAPGYKSAGGHLNPDGKKHGLQSPEGPHAGDIENFTVASNGTAKSMVMAKGITLGNDAQSVFANGGTALVVHAGPDDMKTDPAGASGDPIACGVIVK